MTSGTKVAVKAAAGLLVTFVLMTVAGVPRLVAARPIGALELMKVLASVESANATFVETRYSSLLKSPLVSSGTLSYRRPGLLEQHVQFPRDERFVLQGDHLTIENASGTKTVALRAGEATGVGALIEGIRAARAGDLAALKRSFDVNVSGTRSSWQLQLLPRTPGLAKYVRDISIAGNSARIERIEVHETSGDRTVMEIRETVH